MKRLFQSVPFLVLTALSVVGASLYADIDEPSIDWFQRSGSFMVLIGAVLSYRSIIADGIAGVGSSQSPTIMTGQITDIDDSSGIQKASLEFDERSLAYAQKLAINRLAGFFGAIFIVCGTLIWGYGDLAGGLF